MSKSAIGIILCVVLSSSFSNPVFAQLEELVFMTEDYPPYNYLENGRLKGASVELLLALMLQLGQPIEREKIRVLPWARAYRELQLGPNRVLFMTTRTPERETQFQWVGPMTYDYLGLVANRSKKLRITQASQLQNLRIGLVRDDVSEEFLQEFDIDEGLVIRGNSPINVAKLLVADRIDLWSVDPRGASRIIKKIGADPQQYEVVGNLYAAPLYFAFSKDVDADLIADFQRAIDQLRESRPELFPTEHTDVGATDIPRLQ